MNPDLKRHGFSHAVKAAKTLGFSCEVSIGCCPFGRELGSGCCEAKAIWPDGVPDAVHSAFVLRQPGQRFDRLEERKPPRRAGRRSPEQNVHSISLAIRRARMPQARIRITPAVRHALEKARVNVDARISMDARMSMNDVRSRTNSVRAKSERKRQCKRADTRQPSDSRTIPLVLLRSERKEGA
jgi:hypothetical protein